MGAAHNKKSMPASMLFYYALTYYNLTSSAEIIYIFLRYTLTAIIISATLCTGNHLYKEPIGYVHLLRHLSY